MCLTVLGASVAIAAVWGAPPQPLEELARLAREGKLNGATIEYWVGGGLPPPHYRSDQFRLFEGSGGDMLHVARPYNDPVAKRQGLVERFRLEALPDEVRLIARLVIDSGIFDPRFAEEKDPGIADALKTEVNLTVAGREYKRQFFSATPKPVEALRVEVERLKERIAMGGRRDVFRPGQEPSSAAGETAKETIPRAQLAGETVRRILSAVPASGNFVLWINSGSCEECGQTGETVLRALKENPRILYADQVKTGTFPVPAGPPGEHVHMLVYRIEPAPDLVLDISKIDGRLSCAVRDGASDPLAPGGTWRWVLVVP